MSDSPIALAAALRDGLRLDCFYLADLDAIEGRPPDLGLYERLAREGGQVWLDAGVRDRGTLEPLVGLGSDAIRIIVGLESVGGPAELAEIVEIAGPDRLIFSLDMDEGRSRLAPAACWPSDEPLEIASRAVDLGVCRLILLDLARVGTGRGIGTERLLARIRSRCPAIPIFAGGGIRGIDDVLRLEEQGASGVLVGTALHDGRIGRRELDRIARPGRGFPTAPTGSGRAG